MDGSVDQEEIGGGSWTMKVWLGFGGLLGRSSKGGENLGRAGADFKDNCMRQAVIICEFSFVYRCIWQSGLGFGGALGTFLNFL